MRLVLSVLIAAAVCLIGVAAAVPSRANAAECEFVLGFKALHDMIPDKVGDCRGDEYHNPENGDALQETTRGLLVWRKADNVTAFTDGVHSWIIGPLGLQDRSNDQRFSWEWNPDSLRVVPAPSPGDRCHTAGLAVKVQGVDSSADAHTAIVTIRNNLEVPCSLFGFAGVQMLSAQNDPLPTVVVQGGESMVNLPGPAPLTLQSKGIAVFWLQWSDVPAGGENACPTSTQLKVTPPEELGAIIIPGEVTACSGGRLVVSAIAPGVSISHNWSGYVATGGNYTSVTGTWTMPEASTAGGISGTAAWVGIGGVQAEDLIQAGTAAISDESGQMEYVAWIEVLPEPMRPVNVSVRPGDSITVTITQWGKNLWLISLTNNTSGQNFHTTVQYASSASSVEWVLEAPSNRDGVVPLGNFSTVQFTDASAIDGGKRVTIAEAGGSQVTMLDGDGRVAASTSALNASGNGFSVSRVVLAAAGAH